MVANVVDSSIDKQDTRFYCFGNMDDVLGAVVHGREWNL
jgi:hypothetical protein